MKIVIAVEEFDVNKGYLEYHLAKELARLGNEVYVFTFGNKRSKANSTLCEGFTIIRFKVLIRAAGYSLTDYRTLIQVLSALKKIRPSVIHCQPLDSPLSMFLIAFSKLFGYKIVGPILTQLNLIFVPWSFKKKILFCLSKILISSYLGKRSAMLFAKTSGLKKIIARSYGVSENKFKIIPLGTDISLYKYSRKARLVKRRELNLSEKDIVIVYSGKVDSSKGLDILLRALSPIIAQKSHVKLLLIGSGKESYIHHLKSLTASLELTDNVIFYPWVQKKDLPTLYSASDIAVWPGLSSISIVDAASIGLPLIIANVPVETFAIANKNGFTFPLGNIKELHKNLAIS